MSVVVLDIETARGSGDFVEHAVEYAERRGDPTTVESVIERAPLSAVHGRIVAIGWAVDDRPVRSVVDLEDEGRLLHGWLVAMNAASKALGKLVFAGHNIRRFDAPFLKTRALIHGRDLAHNMLHHLGPLGGKPWGGPLIDTLDLWPAPYGILGDKALVAMCRALGIDQDEDDVKGNGMQAAVDRGDVPCIRRHVESDVERVRLALRRLQLVPETTKSNDEDEL